MIERRTKLTAEGIHRTAGPWAALFTLLVIASGLLVGRYVRLMPPIASEEAVMVDGLFRTMLGIAAAVFLLVLGSLLYAVFRFRKRPGHQGEGIPIHGSNRLEFAWTFIPALIVFWLAAYSSQVLVQLHDPDKHALQVNVIARQFVWQFEYPEFGIVSTDLHVPADRPVRLELLSQDVIHSFWVPAFRIKQDAFPQRSTLVSFTANRLGKYPVVCAELCGAGHAVMRSQVVVHELEDFTRWVEEQTG
jgi:cytochrome c oxidase subunit 2